MENSIVRRFRVSILLWTNFQNISWFLIFAVHSLPRNTAKITRRENFPFYGILKISFYRYGTVMKMKNGNVQPAGR